MCVFIDGSFEKAKLLRKGKLDHEKKLAFNDTICAEKNMEIDEKNLRIIENNKTIQQTNESRTKYNSEIEKRYDEELELFRLSTDANKEKPTMVTLKEILDFEPLIPRKTIKKIAFDEENFFNDSNSDLLGLRYSELLGPIAKAIQELSDIVKQQQKQINALIHSQQQDDLSEINDQEEEEKLKELEKIRCKNEMKRKILQKKKSMIT